MRHGIWLVVIATAWAAAAACGPLRLEDAPQIRGTVVSVDGPGVGIKHKTGRTYDIEITRDTRVVNRVHPGDTRLCPGQRATVSLAAPHRFTASSITLWSGGCR